MAKKSTMPNFRKSKQRYRTVYLDGGRIQVWDTVEQKLLTDTAKKVSPLDESTIRLNIKDILIGMALDGEFDQCDMTAFDSYRLKPAFSKSYKRKHS